MNGSAETQIQKSALSIMLHYFGKKTGREGALTGTRGRNTGRRKTRGGNLQRFSEEAGKVKELRKNEEKEV